jgi:hypothetical protein
MSNLIWGKLWQYLRTSAAEFMVYLAPPPTSSLRAARVDGRAAMFATINALKLTISHL